jgi:putative ABC transport system permease protein
LLDSLVALVPFPLPLTAPVEVDLAVLAFTTTIAAATALLFSIAPFLMSSRVDVQETLKGAGRTAGGTLRQRVRGFLVVSEVALSVSLLAGAALLTQSLYRLHQESLGFTSRGVLTFFTPPAQRYPEGPAYWQFEQSVLEKLQSLPGVRAAAAINVLPLTSQNNYPTQQAGHPEHSIGGMEIRQVSYGYFETMGIPIRLGRGITARDSEAAPPVVVVNETVAHKWWPEGNPLGDHVLIGWFNGKDAMESGIGPREVVGVAGDTKSVYLKSPARPTIYLATAQSPWYGDGTSWVVRTDSPAALAGRLRAAIAAVNPRQAVERIRPMDEIVNGTMADSRFDAWLFGSFAVLALLLSAIGVYGLLSFTVARRTNEIGTRMALGASRGNVLLLVLRQGAALIVMGLAAGLAGALLLTRSLESLLFGVHATDAGSFVVVALVMLAAGLLASYLPARRATKVDPMAALRYE